MNQPKHLLEVGGRPILERLLDQLAEIEQLEHVYVVTNAKFADRFREFAGSWHGRFELTVVDDGTTSDADKLGAIGDISLVIARAGLASSDLIVVAGDNLFCQSLEAFGTFCHAKNQPVLGVYDVGSLDEAKKYGVVAVGASGEITSFEEKPAEPKSTLIGIALYYYPAKTVAEFTTYLAAGNNPDQPGRFVQWLYQRTPVQTWEVPGTWFDVGSKETLEEANKIFAQFAK